MNAVSGYPIAVPQAAQATFADAVTLLRARPGIAPARLRDLVSDLTAAARMLGLPLAAVPCDIAWLNARLFQQPPAAFRMSQCRHRNVMSSVRAVLRMLGLHHSRGRGEHGLPAEWLELLRAAVNEGQRAGLRGFAHYCAGQGLGPVEVSDAVLAAYLAVERETRLAAGTTGRGVMVARAWNRAIPGATGLGPCRPLKAPPQRERYTLPIERYPESLQAEVRSFREHMSPSSGRAVFSQGNGGKRRREATVKARLFTILQLLAALVRLGHDPASITSLRYVVEHAGAILDFHHERAVARLPPDQRKDAVIVGGQVAVIADVLLIIGRHLVGLTGAPLRQLQAWRKQASPRRQPGLTGKVRERLRRLIEPHTRSSLLVLLEDILEAAGKQGARDPETARRVKFAVALEILLVCPLRMKNLTGLRLDRHLQRIGPGGRWITHIVIEGTETKNEEVVEWPVPPGTAKLLETWLQVWRPLIAGEDAASLYLFPGRVSGQAMSQSGLGNGLVHLVHRELGVRIHPHLLRHFAAWRHLNRHPGQYEIVRRALGHKSVVTTIGTYCGLETESLARVFHKGLDDDRVEARRLVRAAQRAKPRPRHR